MSTPPMGHHTQKCVKIVAFTKTEHGYTKMVSTIVVPGVGKK